MDRIETTNFKRLIGIWKTEGTILTNNHNSKLIGTDSYELILNGHCILHKADVKMGNEKSQTFEIIAIDNSTEKAKMQFYNSKGESGSMTSSLIKNNFKIEGDKIKFEGTIDDDNAEIVGKWFLQVERNKWVEYIDLKLSSPRNKN